MINIIQQVQAQSTSDIFGTIAPFGGGDAYGDVAAGEGGLTQPIVFVNNILGVGVAAAGIWFIITVIMAGVKIIGSARDPKVFSESMKKVLWSTIGLALVAFAYIISGWISESLFGDPNYILNPAITNPVSVWTTS